MPDVSVVIDNSLFFPVDAADSSVIHTGVSYWRELRGPRRFPSRDSVTLRSLRGLAKYATLLRVIDGGQDYEFRLVGDVPMAALGENFQGRRLSELDVFPVVAADFRHHFYDTVVQSGEPWVFKSRNADHVALKFPVHSETVYLPLGVVDEDVDHLLGFTVFSA